VDQVLDATVGGTEALQLSAFLIDENGTRSPAPNAWWGSLDLEVGDVDQNGLFNPSRQRAGLARIRARAAGAEAITTIRVRLAESITLDGNGDPAAFNGALSSAGGPPLLYPEHDVVIPANLAAMLFQWNKVGAHARLQLTGDGGSLTLFTDANQAAAPEEAWRRFLVAHLGLAVGLTLDESDGPGTDIRRSTLTLHVAEADLTATVYYWAVNAGKIVRIDADSLQPQSLGIAFEDIPGAAVPADQANQECRACHAVSADGQTMAFTYFEGNGPGGVVNTNQVDAPRVPNRGNRRWNFAAPSPDGSLLVTNYQRRLSLRDGMTGDVVVGQEDLTGFDAANPAFSPTGTKIAFAGNIGLAGQAAGWEIDFDASDLYTADVDENARTVSNLRLLIPGGGLALFYPSFDPTGSLIAYTLGNHSRSALHYLDGTTEYLDGDLWLANATSGQQVELSRANPGSDSYMPTFNPKIEGGYKWVAFFSRRDYGHVIQGQMRPQIWVAAVDENADPATALADPSHPAFWLPGQDATTSNLSSYFAPKPCEGEDGTCSTDAGCCDNLLCRPGMGGQNQCVPPEEACAIPEEGCAVDGDCCDGLICVLSSEGDPPRCLPPGEVCSEDNQRCEYDADCCNPNNKCVDQGSGFTTCGVQATCSQFGGSCGDDLPCCPGEGDCLNGLCMIVDG
jgi:hypothetical protein